MNWLTDSWKTLSDALGVRRFIVIGTATGTATAATAFYSWAAAQTFFSTWLPFVQGSVIFVLVIAGVALVAVVGHATSLRKAAEPKIVLESPVVREGDASVTLSLVVRNAGGILLDNCHVTLLSMTPIPRHLRAEQFPLGLLTVGQDRGGRSGGFTLRGSYDGGGQFKNVVLIEWEKFVLSEDEAKLITELETNIWIGSRPGDEYAFKVAAFANAGGSSTQEFRITFGSPFQMSVIC